MQLFNWPFGDINPQSADLIVADPPWDFSNYSEKGERKSPKKHYRCLPTDQIASFPVLDIAKEHCALLLWTTNPMLDEGRHVMRQWGFTYKTQMTWIKTTVNGKLTFGTGYVLRSCSEQVMIGTRGKPQFTRSTRSAFFGVAREHSRKPEEFYPVAEKMLDRKKHKRPEMLELFSRTNRPGWESWGDEVGKFNQVSA
jgi:N6-adenosine-specific RNA methylase IME4